jgi:hypothetical protein
MDMNGVPGAADPWPLPVSVAANRLADEAAWIFAGEVWGFEFDWTPSDRARNIAEYFMLTPMGAIQRGDERLVPEEAHTEGSSLLAWVSYRPSEADATLLASYGRSPWRSAQGMGKASYLKGYEGRRLAYEDSAREALRDLLRGMEPNKPRRVRGRIVFAGQPRLIVSGGNYVAQARFRIDETDLQSYEVY